MSIKVSFDNLWKFFEQNRKRLSREWILIASNESENTEVFISEHNHFPVFSVEIGGIEETKEETISQIDAEDTYKRILYLYVLEEDFNDEPDIDDFTEAEEVRIAELVSAAKDFLSTVVDEPSDVYFSEEELYSFLSLTEGFLSEYGCYISLEPTE